MKRNIKHHRFWFITGIETAVLGGFFLFAPNFLDSGTFRQLFNLLDNTIPAVFLVVIGTFTVINAAFQVEPNWHRMNVSLREFLWAFYAATFLVHDLQGDSKPIVSLTTLLLLTVAIRIFLESWWEESSGKRGIKIRDESK